MTTGRTTAKHVRFYADGYDLSGYSRSVGPLVWQFAEAEGTTFTDAVRSAQPGQANISPGSLTGNLNNMDSSAMHDVMNAAGVKRDIMVPLGIQAAPAEGDPVYCSQNQQLDYLAVATAGELVSVTLAFGAWAADGDSSLYAKPWGDLLHEKSAEIAMNATVAVMDNGASSALGGYMMYQLFSSDGTVTLLTEDAATNTDPSFSTLSTSGSLDASSTPESGIVALAITATVERYLRWQIVFGTGTTATFALAFVRG